LQRIALRYFLYIAVLSLITFSCKKEQDLSAIDLGYDYFPVQVGSFVEYKVDSTYYGITVEEYSYYVREVITEEFLDNTGQNVFRIERSLKHFSSQPWILMDAWTQKRTTTVGERVEENIRYVKMEFPVEEGGTWKGNVYNTLGDWDYKYVNVDQPVDLGLLEFENSVTVEQRNVSNLVEEQVFKEIYAKGVGLVYKKKKSIVIQSGVQQGYQVVYHVNLYGSD
jgi:hypothetical protein